MSIKTKDGVPLYDPGDVTLRELMTHNFRNGMEDSDYYYLYEQYDHPDESWWVIDKKTREVYWTFGYELGVNDVFDKATPIDPKTLKRVS